MIFGNMLLSADTSSFEVQEEGMWPGFNPGDWGNWQWPWNNTNGDNHNWPWNNPNWDNNNNYQPLGE